MKGKTSSESRTKLNVWNSLIQKKEQIAKKWQRAVFSGRFRIYKILFRVSKGIVKKLQPFFQHSTYILFDNLYEKDAECIDTFCLFSYMREHGMKAYYVVWKGNKTYERILTQTKGDHLIVLKKPSKERGTYFFEFWFKVLTKIVSTKAVITSFGELQPSITEFLFKSPYIIYHHVNHGSTLLKTFVLKTDYLSYKKFNKFLISNEMEEKIFQRFGWDKKNLPMFGLPRWDLLKRIPHPDKTILMFFTWRRSFGPWFKRQFRTPLEKTQYFINLRRLLTHQGLHEIISKNICKVKFAFHHAMIDQCSNAISLENLIPPGIEIVDASNIQSQIGKTDLFITDFSSLFFDFAFIDVPICFYHIDANDKTLVSDDEGDWTHAKQQQKQYLYNVCPDIDDVMHCIEKYINNGFELEEEYKTKNAKLFKVRSNIRQKFVEYLEQL